MKQKDITGQRYGRLIALRRVPDVNDRTSWLCKCDCGIEKVIKLGYLTAGHTKSCGCLNSELRKARAKIMYSACIKHKTPREASIARVYHRRYDDGNLTLEDFTNLIFQNCHYCGSVPSNVYYNDDKKAAHYMSPESRLVYQGIDRIDSTKSHDKDNCVPCCFQCNSAKSNYTAEEFKSWIERTYKHLFQKEVEVT